MCYNLFYFDGMQTHETPCKEASGELTAIERNKVHCSSFTIVRDSRKRKVRGLWRRGAKLYLQTRITGEKSARRIPLKALTLEDAKIEMADIQKKKRDVGLDKTGIRPKFEEYCDRYLKFHETAASSGKKARTIARERHSLVHWKKALGHVRLDKITKPMITGYVKERLESGLKPRTVNIDVIILRNVLKEAREEGLLSALPTEGIKPKKVSTPHRPLLSPAQFQSLCDAAAKCGKNGQQLLDYLRFLAFTGARRDEALTIAWENVDFDKALLCIGSDGLSKNSKARYIDLNPNLEGHLRDMWTRRAPDSQWVFPSPQRGGKDAPAKTFRESLLLARKEAGLDWVGFHDLRHYFISMAVMAGIDFMTIAEWVGHQDGGVLIGKVYGHLLDGHKKNMASKLAFGPAIVKFPEQATGLAVATTTR